jgi:hypothetical protein
MTLRQGLAQKYRSAGEKRARATVRLVWARSCKRSFEGVLGRTECPECAKRYTQRRSELKRRAIEYLGGQCADCGLQTDIVAVYDFHHKDGGEKTAGLSDFLTLKNWQRMQEELDKCVLLCANCHRALRPKAHPREGIVWTGVPVHFHSSPD